ncbi:MAG TPA: ferritin-like protein, partial [Actinomycetota bacterium]|nr:ferritin-like protein [Actinomycetota bacterium]
MSDTRVADLLAVAETDRDREWLRRSLQTAVELELSTLPPYLCGLWSIKNQAPSAGSTPDAYSIILSVVLEEMVHMGLACNMLSAVGGTPHLVAPTYPGHLPGGVRPDLIVYLSGLTEHLVHHVFMGIELPEHPVAEFPAPSGEPGGTYPTIGAFYDAIRRAFAQGGESLIVGGPQLTTSFSDQENETIYPITSVLDAQKAIQEIKEQGEGTSRTPDAPGFHELAHYYRFGEIYHGRTLIEVAPGRWDYGGDPVPFPECWPMAKVPAGGYPQDITGSFDGLFTSVLANLEAAWVEGGTTGQSFLQNGVNVMFTLYPQAVTLMQIPAPGGGNY